MDVSLRRRKCSDQSMVGRPFPCDSLTRDGRNNV